MDYGYLGVETLTCGRSSPSGSTSTSNTGALVQDVVDGSPAEDAGLEEGHEDITFQGQDGITVGGDLIVAVDGKQLTREHDLADEISARRAGENVELTIVRDGERRNARRRARPPSGGLAPLVSAFPADAGFARFPGSVPKWWTYPRRVTAATFL